MAFSLSGVAIARFAGATSPCFTGTCAKGVGDFHPSKSSFNSAVTFASSKSPTIAISAALAP